MAKIIGNPTVTPVPKPDWNQTDPTKADYIKNKPEITSGVYVGSGDMPADCNVQIDPTGIPVDLQEEMKEAAKEEWITIADITTTEEAKHFEFTTDVNGNPFLCKEIHLLVDFSHSPRKADICFGKNGWEAYIQSFTKESNWGLTASAKIVLNCFAEYELTAYDAGWHWFSQFSYGKIVKYNAYECNQYYDKFTFEYTNGGNLPIGTKIKVVGLKA